MRLAEQRAEHHVLDQTASLKADLRATRAEETRVREQLAACKEALEDATDELAAQKARVS